MKLCNFFITRFPLSFVSYASKWPRTDFHLLRLEIELIVKLDKLCLQPNPTCST